MCEQNRGESGPSDCSGIVPRIPRPGRAVSTKIVRVPSLLIPGVKWTLIEPDHFGTSLAVTRRFRSKVLYFSGLAILKISGFEQTACRQSMDCLSLSLG